MDEKNLFVLHSQYLCLENICRNIFLRHQILATFFSKAFLENHIGYFSHQIHRLHGIRDFKNRQQPYLYRDSYR